MNPLVSVVTPCLNGEKYIDRYANSLLSQDYTPLQIIFMDDGSTDKTHEKIEKYREKFEEKGYSLEYYYHTNRGLAATIGAGLLHVRGDYLIWPDVDDYMPSDSIKKKVEFLELHSDYGVVRTDFKTVMDCDLNKSIGSGAKIYPGRFEEKVFEDYVNRSNAWYQPGCFMIRMEKMREVNPNFYIFNSSAGQNIQMLLPIFYYSKCGYIDEELFYYVARTGSLSHEANKDYSSRIRNQQLEEECMNETIKNMKIPDDNRYMKMNHISSVRILLDIAYKGGNQADAKRYYMELKKNGATNLKSFIKGHFAGISIVTKLLRNGR